MHERRRLGTEGRVWFPLSAGGKVAVQRLHVIKHDQNIFQCGIGPLTGVLCLIDILISRVKSALIKQINAFSMYCLSVGAAAEPALRLVSARPAESESQTWTCIRLKYYPMHCGRDRRELTSTRHHPGRNETSRGLHVAQARSACDGSDRLCFRWWNSADEYQTWLISPAVKSRSFSYQSLGIRLKQTWHQLDVDVCSSSQQCYIKH